MKTRTRKQPPSHRRPAARHHGKAKPFGLEQTASARALHRDMFGADPDLLGTLVRQAGWAGLDGDRTWALRLVDEARVAGTDTVAVWSAYEAGCLRPDQVAQ